MIHTTHRVRSEGYALFRLFLGEIQKDFRRTACVVWRNTQNRDHNSETQMGYEKRSVWEKEKEEERRKVYESLKGEGKKVITQEQTRLPTKGVKNNTIFCSITDISSKFARCLWHTHTHTHAHSRSHIHTLTHTHTPHTWFRSAAPPSPQHKQTPLRRTFSLSHSQRMRPHRKRGVFPHRR